MDASPSAKDRAAAVRLARVTVRRLRIPLPKPYKVAFNTYTTFDPIVVDVRDADGRCGFGEAHVPPNYSKAEPPEGAWRAALALAERIAGLPSDEAKRIAGVGFEASPMAATAVNAAIEMLEGHPALEVGEEARIPLLVPLSSSEPGAIRDEVDRHLAAGFRTIKVKVGWDVDADLARVDATRAAIDGRAALRLDANRNFSVDDGRRFAAALEADGIELFEQPCGADDWDGNAAVAAVSRVPVMLDESIYSIADVERAARIPNVGFVKIKLKRAGGIGHLLASLARARELGLDPIVGDGVATEIVCWMEACCARVGSSRAGEMNGFLKPSVRLFADPLGFEAGSLVLPAGYRPRIEEGVLDELSRETRVMGQGGVAGRRVARA